MSKSCKESRQRINPTEIAYDLEGYELVKDPLTLRRYDRVKYVRKDNGKYVKGGLVILGDYKKGYIVIEAFGKDYKPCKRMRYSVTLSEVILFRKKD